eukprot:6491742-Amphidinium_carterae.1
MDVKTGIKQPPIDTERVYTNVTYELEIEQRLQVLSEKDMRRLSGLARMPKLALKGVPTLELPAMDGSGDKETVWCFAHPDAEEGRTANLKMKLSTGHSVDKMPPSRCRLQTQGREFLKMTVGEEQQQIGFAELLGETHKLQFWQSFEDEKLKKSTSADASHGDDGAGVQQPQVLKGQLRGAAAAATSAAVEAEKKNVSSGSKAGHASAAFISPPPKSQQQGVQRLSSSSALGGGSIAGDDSSVFLDDGSPADSSVQGQPCMMNTPFALNSLGIVIRRKVPFWKVIDGSIDNRSTNGLKQVVPRLMEKGTPQALADATVLNNYQKMVMRAQQLQPKNLPTLTESELLKDLQFFKDEGVQFSAAYQEVLVNRRIDSLLAAKDHKTLCTVISPWGGGTFDVLAPTLGALQKERKAEEFVKTLCTDLLMPLLYKGDKAVDEVSGLTSTALTVFEKVDTVELGAEDARMLDECLTVWRALRAMTVVPDLVHGGEELQDRSAARAMKSSVSETLSIQRCSLCVLSLGVHRSSSQAKSASIPAHTPSHFFCIGPWQDDVVRVKGGAGTSADSMLSQVATALDNEPFWQQQMEKHVQMAPCMVANAPRVRQYMKKLCGMQGSLHDGTSLLEILRGTAELNALLREGSTKTLMELLLASVKKFWSVLSSTGCDDYGPVMELVAEAATQYPHEQEISDM